MEGLIILSIMLYVFQVIVTAFLLAYTSWDEEFDIFRSKTQAALLLTVPFYFFYELIIHAIKGIKKID